jgi:predicted DNA-binding transcriptional regulator YafY
MPSEQHIMAGLASGNTLEMTYRNWKGVASTRRINPISLRFGTTEWHPTPGWLLLAVDIDKNAEREFALADCDFLSMRQDG